MIHLVLYEEYQKSESLYTWLFYAQLYSELAKHSYDHPSYKYYMKDKYLQKAVNRALKIKLPVYYCESENALYFETVNGQCSFHLGYNTKIDKTPGLSVVSDYPWSGKHNTREIIWSFFNEENIPKTPRKEIANDVDKFYMDEYMKDVKNFVSKNKHHHI